MSKNRSKVMEGRRRSMVPVQLLQRGPMTVPQSGTAAARTIVVTSVSVLREVQCDLKRMDLARQT